MQTAIYNSGQLGERADESSVEVHQTGADEFEIRHAGTVLCVGSGLEETNEIARSASWLETVQRGEEMQLAVIAKILDF